MYSYSKNIIKSTTFRLTQRQGLLAKMAPQITEFVVSDNIQLHDLLSLSTSCTTLYTQTNSVRQKNAMIQLLEAMLDDASEKVSNILKSYPEFIFTKPSVYGIKEIKSRLTWRNYLVEENTVFYIAQKLQLFDIVKIMLPHYINALKNSYERHEYNNFLEIEKTCILHPYSSYNSDVKKSEKAKKTLQDNYYRTYLLNITETLLNDKTIQVHYQANPETTWVEAMISNVSENTISELSVLRNALYSPKTIDESIDMTQLLVAAYNAYDDHGGQFLSGPGLKAYSLLVIGLIQSLIDPQLGKIFCEGLNNVLIENKPIGKKAAALMLKDGESFYRSNCNSPSGQGVTYVCSISGHANKGFGWGGHLYVKELLEKYVLQKELKASKLLEEFRMPVGWMRKEITMESSNDKSRVP